MSVPRKCESPGGAGLTREQVSENNVDSASELAERKALVNISPALALGGYALHSLADGCLLIEYWGHSRTLDSVNQADQFLTQIGGR